MLSFREAMSRSNNVHNTDKPTIAQKSANIPVEHIYAEKDFVVWAHNNLCYGDIRDTIQKLNSADKVWVGRLYVAWKNKNTDNLDLFAGHQQVKSGRPLCEICGAWLSRTDCFNNLHFGDGSGRCQLHYTTPTVDSTPPAASNPLPTAFRIQGDEIPDTKYKNVIDSNSCDDSIVCAVCKVLLSMSDIIANRKAGVGDKCDLHRKQATVSVESRPDNVQEPIPVPAQNEIFTKGEDLITRLVDRCIETVLKRTLPNTDTNIKSSNVLMRHVDEDVEDSDAEEATDDLMMSALLGRIDSDVCETKAVEATVKVNLGMMCCICKGECTGADLINFKRNICSLCYKNKLSDDQAKEEFLSKNYVAPNVKFNN
jgi:hypothetical protein